MLAGGNVLANIIRDFSRGLCGQQIVVVKPRALAV
jgi:hypothetical protein